MQDIPLTLANFFLDPLYFRMLYLTVVLFLVAFAIWYMYTSISKRDLFKLTPPGDIKKEPTFMDRLLYMMKYIFFFPILTFLWFVLFVACLKILTAKENLSEIMLLGIVIISAVRIAAYASSKMAEDVAKLLPLTLLAGIILNPSFITLDASIGDLYVFADKLPAFGKYLLFIIALELALRVGHAIYKSASGKSSSREKAKN